MGASQRGRQIEQVLRGRNGPVALRSAMDMIKFPACRDFPKSELDRDSHIDEAGERVLAATDEALRQLLGRCVLPPEHRSVLTVMPIYADSSDE